MKVINKMNKYFKIILCFMAFAVLSFISAFSPVLTSFAVDYTVESYNVAINSIKMPKSTVDVSNDEEFRIPLLSSSMGVSAPSDYTIRVIDPAGQSHDYVVGGAENDATYFDDAQIESDYITIKALNNGKYDILYIVTQDGRTYYSNTYSVTVTNISYELDFTDSNGVKKLVPSALRTGSERIEIPVANVKVADSEDDSVVATVIPVVTVNGAPYDANESDYFVYEGGVYYINPTVSGTYTIEYSYKQGSNPPTTTYTISVQDDFVQPTSRDLTITTPTMPSVELGDKGVTLPSLTLSDNYNDNVDYNIESIVITKTTDSNISITLTNNTREFDMTKEEFGVDSYAELVGNYDVQYNVIDAYGNRKQYTATIRNVTDNTRPSVYMAYDYDLDAETGLPVQVENEDGELVDDVRTDYAVDLKARYGYAELVLPAIYATDKVSDYSEFTFIRYIQNTSTHTIYYIDNLRVEDGEVVAVNEGETGYNYSGDENIGHFNKAVEFRFSADDSDISDYAGQYTLGYYVVSNTVSRQENYVYSSGTTRYTFTVLSSAQVSNDPENTSTPTIEINNVKNNTTIDSDDTISVNVTSKDDIDTRLKNAVFYYYSTTSGNDLEEDIQSAIDTVGLDSTSDYYNGKCNVLDDEKFLTAMQELGYEGFGIASVNANNSNTFDVKLDNYADYQGELSATIVAVTINDNGAINTDTRSIQIKDLTETEAPIFSITNGGDFVSSDSILTDLEKDQVATVVLPTLEFEDDDSSLALDVSYYIGTPEGTNTGLQYFSPTGKQLKNNTIVGGQIITSAPGTYYVVYTATDDAGNTTVVYFTFVVNDSSDPILSVNVEGDDVTMSGNTVTAEAGSIISFDPTLFSSDGRTNLTDDVNTTIDYTIDDNGDGLDYKATGDYLTFQFNDVGEYAVTFTGSYNGRTAIEKTVYVSITMPELTWDFDITVPEYAQQGEEILLPDLTASQGDQKAEVEVTVEDPDGLNVTVDRIVNANEQGTGAMVWRFTTKENVRGTYVVTYTARTDNGSIERTFNIKVGDNVAPTFTMSYENELSQDIVYDGTNQIEYRIDLNRTQRTMTITVMSNGNTIYSYEFNNDNLLIQDRNDSGTQTTMSWSDLEVTLTSEDGIVTSGDEDGQYYINGTGKCTLTLSIEDNYDNVGTKTIEFNVVTESSPNEVPDSIVGAVLIVASLVILAVVILVFAFTGKKGGSSKSKKKKDDIVVKNNDAEKSSKTEKKEEAKVEDKAEESTDEVKENDDNTDTEAKSGEVE